MAKDKKNVVRKTFVVMCFQRERGRKKLFEFEALAFSADDALALARKCYGSNYDYAVRLPNSNKRLI